MKRLLVDMDGVLADVYKQFIKMDHTYNGIEHRMEDLLGKSESEAFRDGRQFVNTPGFFRNAPVIEGAVEGLRYLNQMYEVLIVSSATEFPNSPTEKLQWMMEHFPFISWTQIVICGRKDIISGDIMLDDHPKNLDLFAGRRIIFSQPHNHFVTNPTYERAHNWQEVRQLL